MTEFVYWNNILYENWLKYLFYSVASNLLVFMKVILNIIWVLKYLLFYYYRPERISNLFLRRSSNVNN